MICRLCHSSELTSIIPLGFMPLANSLLSSPLVSTEQEFSFNLEVMLCRHCGLAQLKDLIDPKNLFSHYVYFSSNSITMLQSAMSLVERMLPNLSEDSFVIEIASNDGYLLKNYLKHGIRALGIDPAENIAAVANSEGIPTLCAFFNAQLAKELAQDNQKADIIHANNVMAHVPDLHGFVNGLKIILKDDGIAVIEFPYFVDLIEKLEFDTIYHEHVYYFTVKPLKKLFDQYALDIFKIEKLSIHGGSLRLFVGHAEKHTIDHSIQQYIDMETIKGYFSVDFYQNFLNRVQYLKYSLLDYLKDLKEKDAKIVGYGASAKGSVLLNYFGIQKNLIDFVVDKSPVKQGLFMPGLHIKIYPPEIMLELMPTHTLLLAWNFSEEILTQQKKYRDLGGKFIIPLPQLQTV